DVLVVLERRVGEDELSLALAVDAERAVDHDLGDGVVVQERLDRPEAVDLVEDRFEHLLTLDACDDRALLVEELVEHLFDRGAHGLRVGEVEAGVEVVDDLGLELDPDVAVGVAGRGDALGERAGLGRLRRLLARGLGCARSGRGGRLLTGGTLALDTPQKTLPGNNPRFRLALCARLRPRRRSVRRMY